jgi:hypothetical protein
LVVWLSDGTRHHHLSTADGWQITVLRANYERVITLGGLTGAEESEDAPVPSSTTELEGAQPLVVGTVLDVELGAESYRRSEQSWEEAGCPSATVSVEWTGHALLIGVDVPRSDRTFAPPDAANVYDNESPDINGDGVQLYLGTLRGLSGWMLVPEAESSRVRVRALSEWPVPQPIEAEWRPTEHGYGMRIEIPLEGSLALDGSIVALDVIVNEKPVGRERRRGQLVMSNTEGGGWVYLRGDRHDPALLIPFSLSNA